MKHTDEADVRSSAHSMNKVDDAQDMNMNEGTKRKLVLGVTGGVGAGKSTILNYLAERYNACIIEMDAVGKELQQPGQKVYEEIVKLFGEDAAAENVVLPGGSLNRQLIAAKIFENPSLRDKMNAIVHPAVWDEVGRRIEAVQQGRNPDLQVATAPAPWSPEGATAPDSWSLKGATAPDSWQLIVLESALLIDAGYDKIVDEVWYIYTDKEVRKARLKRDRGYSDEKCEAIFAAQRSDAFFREHAGYVIDNSADCVNNTFKQIDEGMKRHGIL